MDTIFIHKRGPESFKFYCGGMMGVMNFKFLKKLQSGMTFLSMQVRVGLGRELGSPINHLKADYIWNLIKDSISSWSVCIASTKSISKSKGFLPVVGFCSH